MLKNITRRALIDQGAAWWKLDPSPWRLANEHAYADKTAFQPDHWMERALDLCEIDLTHTHFGLTFMDLMHLDPATFEKIEKRVHDFARRQAERMSPELKKELSKK